jgi:hypothetical protein
MQPPMNDHGSPAHEVFGVRAERYFVQPMQDGVISEFNPCCPRINPRLPGPDRGTFQRFRCVYDQSTRQSKDVILGFMGSFRAAVGLRMHPGTFNIHRMQANLSAIEKHQLATTQIDNTKTPARFLRRALVQGMVQLITMPLMQWLKARASSG